MSAVAPRVGFVMEQTLGHVTYAQNLQAAFAANRQLSPVWLPVPFAADGALDRLPLVGRNWALRGSLRAYAAARGHGQAGAGFDALFVHTQTIALLTPLLGRRTPVVLSLDATPLNYDAVGAHYGHHAQPASVAERAKRALYRAVFRRATALTTWSQWAKDSLRFDYGVDPERVTVVAPGVDLSLFSPPAAGEAARAAGPIRILFVGADFERKGGNLLLESFRAGLAGRCELHLVTRSAVPAGAGVHVYRDLGPNDPRLLALYREADLFALPTYADCLAVVLGEAMAAGLPIVTTDVGAQPEAVRNGHSGIVVPPGDAEALGRALARLADDQALRRAMGGAGRAIAEARFDARLNARRLATIIGGAIEGRRGAAVATNRAAA